MGTIGIPDLLAAAPFVCLGVAVLGVGLLVYAIRRRR